MWFLVDVVVRPREAMPAFVARVRWPHILALASVWGVERQLTDKFKVAIPADWLDIWLYLGIPIGGILFGALNLFVIGSVTSRVARWLGGTASVREVCAVLAASCIPRAGSVVALLVTIAITRRSFFLLDRSALSAEFPGLMALMLVGAGFTLWALVVAIQGLSEVARLSVPRTIAAYFVGWTTWLVLLIGGGLGVVVLLQ